MEIHDTHAVEQAGDAAERLTKLSDLIKYVSTGTLIGVELTVNINHSYLQTLKVQLLDTEHTRVNDLRRHLLALLSEGKLQLRHNMEAWLELAQVEPEPEDCAKCNNERQIADSEDGEPWSVWANLAPPANAAVVAGIVKPIPCPRCTPG